MQFSRFALWLAWFALGCGLVFAAMPGVTSHTGRLVLAAAPGANDPWTAADVVQPADLAREIAEKKPASPTVLYVGFRSLFAGAHIAGAVFHGTGSTEAGMAEIKKWADALPRSTNLVIYCGCCPFDKCPNVRPAFVALRQMGFTHLRVLALPENFNADWFEKGFPAEKGM
jgi:thiosulfate/3-mercaptopyruvate sulfurtransferase